MPYNSAEYTVNESAGPNKEFRMKPGPITAAPTFPFIPLPSVYTIQLSVWD